MGLFEKKQPQGPTLEQRMSDLEMVAKGLGEKFESDVKEIHEALNILDEDVLEMKNTLPQKVAQMEATVKDLVKVVDDMKIFGRLAVQLKEDVEELKNIVINNGLHTHEYHPQPLPVQQKQKAVDKTKLQEKISQASKEAQALQTK
jgi:ribosomal protein S13